MLKVVYSERVGDIDFELLEKKLQHLWEEEVGGECRELSIVFVGEGEMREMNRTYRGKDSPTDVLSFSFLEGFEQPIPEDMDCPPVGEIVVCIDVVMKEMAEYGESFHQVVERLIIHGVLHILGYEHEGVDDETAWNMQKKEREYLGR